jgi:hypothetical protein
MTLHRVSVVWGFSAGFFSPVSWIWLAELHDAGTRYVDGAVLGGPGAAVLVGVLHLALGPIRHRCAPNKKGRCAPAEAENTAARVPLDQLLGAVLAQTLAQPRTII